MTPYTFTNVHRKLKHDLDLERLSGLLDSQEEGADLNFVSIGQRFSVIERNCPAIQGGRARCTEIDEVEITFDLVDPRVQSRDRRVVKPNIGIRQPADPQSFADDGFRIYRAVLAGDDEGAFVRCAH